VLAAMGIAPLLGCGPKQAGVVAEATQRPPDQQATPQAVPFKFVDVAETAGIRFRHTDGSSGRHYFVEQIGAGCAFIDYDNDGLLDIYAVNGAPLPGYSGPANPRPALYHNLGNGKFEDVTEKAGLSATFYGHGVCAGDFDNDGFVDLFVTCTGQNHLYRNLGNGRFQDVALSAGVADDEGIHTSACFVDYDNDGRLDLYVCRYVQWSLKGDRWCGAENVKKRYCGPEVYAARQDILYHNNGNGAFSDVSRQTRIVQPRSKSLGVVATDVNDDGWPDLYVACDLEPNLLLVNTGKAAFNEQGASSGVAFSGDGASEAGMGVSAVDYDNDGRMDLFVTNYSFEMYGLYKNQGSGYFTYESQRSGIGPPTLVPLGFGTRFADFDNSGWQSCIVADGHVLDDIHETNQSLEWAQTMQLLQNQSGRFKDVSAQSGPAFQQKFVGRGLAAGDFDNDGRIDVLVNNNRGPLRLIHNESSARGHWLTIQLQGVHCNRSAIGARVTVKSATGTQIQEVASGSSYLSQSDLRLHFGLGEAAGPQEVTVRWPGSNGRPGGTETWKNLPVDRTHRLMEGASRPGGETRS
jgi:hypothetical protein